ncbi:MAG: hypothetical protein GX121_08320 [Ignavibacteria bacterium]|nr:hypothetical protein [Ignavibacteria bacterium]
MRYLLLLLFSFSIISAQNFDADTLHFFYGNEPNTPRQLSPNYEEFQTNKFLRGFHWSGDSLIDKLMGMNIHVGGSKIGVTEPNSYCDSTYIIRKTYYVGANGNQRTPTQAQAMQFDARLKIDPTKDCNVLENDNLQSIFGFINVKGEEKEIIKYLKKILIMLIMVLF